MDDPQGHQLERQAGVCLLNPVLDDLADINDFPDLGDRPQSGVRLQRVPVGVVADQPRLVGRDILVEQPREEVTLACATVADDQDALVVGSFQKLKIGDHQIGELLGHPVRDDEGLDELAKIIGRVCLLELDDRLDRLEADKIPILHGDARLCVLPIGVERYHEGLDLRVLRELAMPRLGVGQGPVPECPVPGGHKCLVPARIQFVALRLELTRVGCYPLAPLAAVLVACIPTAEFWPDSRRTPGIGQVPASEGGVRMRSDAGPSARGISKTTFVLALVALGMAPARAGVLFQGYFKGVPTPGPGQQVEFWYDHIARQAKALREAGFSAILLPCPLKADGGNLSDGFDVFDDYDLGSKRQKGTTPTRFGTREQLERCVAILRANGIDVYVELVENQRDGGDDFKYRYVDADGKPDGGRFAKDKGDFHPNVPQDPGVFDDSAQFGDDLAPINGKPPNHCRDGLFAAADWMTRALDVQGFRLDDAKGTSTVFLRALLEQGALKGKFAVGEFFDGNLDLVRRWVSDPAGMAGRASAFDFPLRFNQLQKMTNNAGFFDMSQLDHAGMAGVDPSRAVTWVENHDTNEDNNRIVQNKPQAYAYILTSEGYPCVFYKDYSTDPGSFGMKKIIDNLIFIHEKIADGATEQRFKTFDIFAYERLGGAHLLVGLNNNGTAAHSITVQTGFGAGVKLHDYSGHSDDVQTDGSGKATITIPKNAGGLGYVCYSREGIGGPFDIAAHDVTQDYEGAQDLDIKPADNTTFVPVCRVFVAAGRPIKGALSFDNTKWTDTTAITLKLHDPSGAELASHEFVKHTPQGESISANAGMAGFYAFRIRSSNTPVENVKPSYKLSVSYRAPQVLEGNP